MIAAIVLEQGARPRRGAADRSYTERASFRSVWPGKVWVTSEGVSLGQSGRHRGALTAGWRHVTGRVRSWRRAIHQKFALGFSITQTMLRDSLYAPGLTHLLGQYQGQTGALAVGSTRDFNTDSLIVKATFDHEPTPKDKGLMEQIRALLPRWR